MPEPITREDLEVKVADVHMAVVEGRLTTAVLRLHSGFLVTGESVVQDPAKFDQELGAQLAYANGIEKLYQFEAYHRAELAAPPAEQSVIAEAPSPQLILPV